MLSSSALPYFFAAARKITAQTDEAMTCHVQNTVTTSLKPTSDTARYENHKNQLFSIIDVYVKHKR